MTQYILLALIAVNCVLIGINWRMMLQLNKRKRDFDNHYKFIPYDVPEGYADPGVLYVRGVNVSDQFIGKGQPVRKS